MGDKVTLTVEERKIVGKKVRQLRKQGLVPGVLYGNDVTATPVTMQAIAGEKTWRDAGKHQPVELTLGDKTHLAMIKSADLDPVKRHLRHVSFHVVKQNEKVETEVALHVANEGETAAEKAGLVVLKTIETVQIEALPRDLPEFVEVASDTLVEAGDHVTVADIIAQPGVTILSDPAQVIATVYEPGALAAKNEALAGEATEETEVEAENGTAEPEAAAENGNGKGKA